MKTRTKDGNMIHELKCFPGSPDFTQTKKFKSAKMKKGMQSPCSRDSDSIEIIQDFKMPDVCTSIQMTDDEDFIFVTGIYTPRVKCFDVNNISMKFERCMDSEIIRFAMMSRSFHSVAFLQHNKQLELHGRRGRQNILQMTSYGRDLSFLDFNQQLFVVGSSPDILRVDMNQGSFSTSMKSKAKELNTCTANNHFNTFTTGSSEGLIENWDPRTERSSSSVLLARGSLESTATCLGFFDDHIFGVGTSEGQVFVLDDRWLETPVSIKEGLGGPINRVVCRRRNGKEDIVVSADDSSIKMWYKDSGEMFAEVHPGAKVNDFLLVPDTGLVFVASECSDILSYFIPDLGGSPKWCNVLSCLNSDE